MSNLLLLTLLWLILIGHIYSSRHDRRLNEASGTTSLGHRPPNKYSMGVLPSVERQYFGDSSNFGTNQSSSETLNSAYRNYQGTLTSNSNRYSSTGARLMSERQYSGDSSSSDPHSSSKRSLNSVSDRHSYGGAFNAAGYRKYKRIPISGGNQYLNGDRYSDDSSSFCIRPSSNGASTLVSSKCSQGISNSSAYSQYSATRNLDSNLENGFGIFEEKSSKAHSKVRVKRSAVPFVPNFSRNSMYRFHFHDRPFPPPYTSRPPFYDGQFLPPYTSRPPFYDGHLPLPYISRPPFYDGHFPPPYISSPPFYDGHFPPPYILRPPLYNDGHFPPPSISRPLLHNKPYLLKFISRQPFRNRPFASQAMSRHLLHDRNFLSQFEDPNKFNKSISRYRFYNRPFPPPSILRPLFQDMPFLPHYTSRHPSRNRPFPPHFISRPPFHRINPIYLRDRNHMKSGYNTGFAKNHDRNYNGHKSRKKDDLDIPNLHKVRNSNRQEKRDRDYTGHKWRKGNDLDATGLNRYRDIPFPRTRLTEKRDRDYIGHKSRKGDDLDVIGLNRYRDKPFPRTSLTGKRDIDYIGHKSRKGDVTGLNRYRDKPFPRTSLTGKRDIGYIGQKSRNGIPPQFKARTWLPPRYLRDKIKRLKFGSNKGFTKKRDRVYTGHKSRRKDELDFAKLRKMSKISNMIYSNGGEANQNDKENMTNSFPSTSLKEINKITNQIEKEPKIAESRVTTLPKEQNSESAIYIIRPTVTTPFPSTSTKEDNKITKKIENEPKIKDFNVATTLSKEPNLEIISFPSASLKENNNHTNQIEKELENLDYSVTTLTEEPTLGTIFEVTRPTVTTFSPISSPKEQTKIPNQIVKDLKMEDSTVSTLLKEKNLEHIVNVSKETKPNSVPLERPKIIDDKNQVSTPKTQPTEQTLLPTSPEATTLEEIINKWAFVYEYYTEVIPITPENPFMAVYPIDENEYSSPDIELGSEEIKRNLIENIDGQNPVGEEHVTSEVSTHKDSIKIEDVTVDELTPNIINEKRGKGFPVDEEPNGGGLNFKSVDADISTVTSVVKVKENEELQSKNENDGGRIDPLLKEIEDFNTIEERDFETTTAADPHIRIRTKTIRRRRTKSPKKKKN